MDVRVRAQLAEGLTNSLDHYQEGFERQASYSRLR